MLKIAPLSLVLALSLCTATAVQASSRFIFKDVNGKEESVPVVDKYYPKKIANYTAAKVDRKMSPQLVHAATIAQERARAHSKSLCWRYVKEALVASGAVNSYPKTSMAKQAGDE